VTGVVRRERGAAVPHVSAVPREARPYQGRRAGVVSRTVAAAVDLCVVVAALLGAYAGWAALLLLLNPQGFRFPDASPFLGFVAAFLMSVAYLTVAWVTTGRTYGDHVMGLRVVNRRGGHLGLAVAAARAVAYAVFPIGLYWAAVSRDNRSLPDLVLRTSVIYDWEPADSRGS